MTNAGTIDGMGQLLKAEADSVSGWAWLPSQPSQRVKVEILDDWQTVLVTTTAGRFDRTLIENGIGDGFHGFTVRVPEGRFRAPEMLVRARIQGSTSSISGGPFKIVRAVSDKANILAQLVPPAFSFTLNMPQLRPAALGEAEYSAFGAACQPDQPIEFHADISGSGWIGADEGGCRVGPKGLATIWMSGLPDRPSRILLTVRGPETTISTLTLHCDQRLIPLSAVPSIESDEFTVIGSLPAAGLIRTEVAFRIGASPDLIFKRARLRPLAQRS